MSGEWRKLLQQLMRLRCCRVGAPLSDGLRDILQRNLTERVGGVIHRQKLRPFALEQGINPVPELLLRFVPLLTGFCQADLRIAPEC